MKKLVFIVALFVSQTFYGQYYTIQVFANWNDIYEYNSSTNSYQLTQPLHDFLNLNGYYNPDLTNSWVGFNDDSGDSIFPMYVVPGQANQLENLLINSNLVLKHIRYNGETPFALDRLIFRYHVGLVPQFLGIQNGIAQTDYQPLNNLFQTFQVDNYEQTFPSAIWPINLAVHHIRCDGCYIFQLAQDLLNIGIIDIGDLVEFGGEILLSNENDLLNQFSLNPNPNSGNFQILFNNNEYFGTQLKIFDALGRKVYEEKLVHPQNTIRLNGITPGLYFAQLSFNERISAKKSLLNNNILLFTFPIKAQIVNI